MCDYAQLISFKKAAVSERIMAKIYNIFIQSWTFHIAAAVHASSKYNSQHC
jgi:hypothetical protein